MFEFIKKLTDNFKSADMSISGNMKISSLQSDFRKNFGLYLRVYKGNRFANPDITIAKLNKTSSSKIDTKADDFTLKASMGTKDVENLFMENFGIKVQVAEYYNRHLVSDNLTLGENSRRIGEDKDCQEKFGMDSLEYIKSKGFETLEDWVVNQYATHKLGNSDFVGKARGVFSLNFPHLFIRFDNNKVDENEYLKELNKLSDVLDFSKKFVGDKKVVDFEKDMSDRLNCEIKVIYQRKAKAHYKLVLEIDKDFTLNDADQMGEDKSWSNWKEWVMEKAVKYN